MKKIMMVMTMVSLLAVVGCNKNKATDTVTTTESAVTEQAITPVAITEEAVTTTEAGM